MDLNKRTHSRSRTIACFYLLYTGAFLLTAAVVFREFWAGGRSFIYKSDGLWQHYLALMYYGKWLRGILLGLIRGRGLQVPLWDFSIGFGTDVLSTFSYYVMGDPLALTAAAVPARYTETLYNILVVLRLYLAGASFAAFCLYRKKRPAAVLAGSLTYAFCAYAVYGGIRHPFFVNPMIWFPLLLIGIDRSYKEKKDGLFVLFVFFGAISNFYFFYMLVLGCVIYFLFRFFEDAHAHPWREIGKCIRHFFFLGITGTLMAMVVFLPTVLMFQDTLRSGATTHVSLFYSWNYYRNFLRSFLLGRGTWYWTLLGYAWPSLIAVILLFADRILHRRRDLQEKRENGAERKMLRIAFLVLTGMLMLPVFGKIWNGFSYVSNRWVWIYSALVSYILVCMWEDIFRLFTSRRIRRIAVTCVFAAMILHLGWNGWYRYSRQAGGGIKDYLRAGKAFQKLTANRVKKLEDILSQDSDRDFYRIERSSYGMTNAEIIYGFPGMQSYWSLSPGRVSRFLLQMGLSPYATFSYSGLDSRTLLGSLAAEKYYVSYDGTAPYGFRQISRYKKKYRVFENTLPVGLGYASSSYLTDRQLEEMDPLERAEVMLQGTVLEEEGVRAAEAVCSALPDEKLTDSSLIRVPAALKAGKNARVDDQKTFTCLKKRGKVDVCFEGRDNCETYLLLKGLKADLVKNHSRLKIRTRSGSGHKTVSFFVFPNSRCWYGQTDLLINLGYSSQAQTSARITMGFKGTYSFEEIQVICRPMDSYEAQIRKRQGQVSDLQMGVNRIKAQLHQDKDALFCFSVPYSRGWKLLVDGQEQKLYPANLMYMAAVLPAGDHRIVLTYCTPGLKAGICCSLAGWAFFLFLILKGKHGRAMKKER